MADQKLLRISRKGSEIRDKMDERTEAFYSRNAGRLALDYQQADSDYFATLDRAFEKAGKILDVGCGAGRDCACLLGKGKDVYGVDASPEMLAEAKALFKRKGHSSDGRLFQGALPDLSQFSDGEFDGLLCSAVLMHLPEEAIFDAVYSLRRVLRPGGVLLISVPSNRPDIDPQTRRDGAGRLFTRLPAARLRLLFEWGGFKVDGTEAIKRLTQDANHWIFESDNPTYEPVRVPKNEIAHPILGTMLGKLSSAQT